MICEIFSNFFLYRRLQAVPERKNLFGMCVVRTSLKKQIQRVESKRGTLTNWNSVADPAPASAVLSAPAEMRNTDFDASNGLIYYRTRTDK